MQSDGRRLFRRTATRHEAESLLVQLRTQLRTGAYVDPRGGRMPLGEFFEAWLAGREVRDSVRAAVRGHVASIHRTASR